MTYGIYCIEHLSSGRKYVGKSKNIEKRFTSHKSLLRQPTAKNGVNNYLYNLTQLYGLDSLKFWIIEEIFEQDDTVLADREIYWMDFYNSCDRSFGFNLKRDSSSKTTFTEEAKRNIAFGKMGAKNPNYGRPMDEKLRAILHRKGEANSNYGKTGVLSANYGIKRSDETKRRLSESKRGENNHNFGKYGADSKSYGFKHSEESKEKMRQAGLGKKLSQETIDKRTLKMHKYSFEAYYLDGRFDKLYLNPKEISDAGHLPPNVTAANRDCRVHHGRYWIKILKVSPEDRVSYEFASVKKYYKPEKYRRNKRME